MGKMLAPIVVFGYNRADKLKQCLLSLKKCRLAIDSELFIFVDGNKSDRDLPAVEETRKVAFHFLKEGGFKDVHTIISPKNKGLSSSVIFGVSKIINEYRRVIVVEDDLIVSKDFLEYMNDALDFYEMRSQYGSISAYTYPIISQTEYQSDIYATRKGDCWGWGTWADRWQDVDWEMTYYSIYRKSLKKRLDFCKLQYNLDEMLYLQYNHRINSWAVRWCYHLFQKGLLTIYPVKSRVMNTGDDDRGTHIVSSIDEFNVGFEEDHRRCMFEERENSRDIEKECALFGRPNCYVFGYLFRRMRDEAFSWKKRIRFWGGTK